MKNICIISGVITTEAPLSIAMPVAQGAKENKFKNFPLMQRGEGETGYLPATTIRGAIRRGAAMSLINDGEKVEMKKLYMDFIGQLTNGDKKKAAEGAGGDGEIDLIAHAAEREANQVIDLFGAGMGFKSRLRVSHWLPANNVLPTAFTTVRKDLDQTDGVLDLMTAEDRAAFTDRSGANSRRAAAAALEKKLKRDLMKVKTEGGDIGEIKAQLEAAEAVTAGHKDAMGDLSESSKHLPTHYALPMSLALAGKMVIEDFRDRDLDLIIAGLNALSLWPIIGANSARGAGEISGVFDVRIGGELIKTIRVGGFAPVEVIDLQQIAA